MPPSAKKVAPSVKFIAGGTNLVDLMKYNVERPERLVDINAIALREIADAPGGGLRIGALVTNSTCAYDTRIGQRYPLLRNTILSGASPQLRNAATTGGNLLQRTRGAIISTTSTRLATSASRAAAARRSAGSTASTPSSAPARSASRPTRRT